MDAGQHEFRINGVAIVLKNSKHPVGGQLAYLNFFLSGTMVCWKSLKSWIWKRMAEAFFPGDSEKQDTSISNRTIVQPGTSNSAWNNGGHLPRGFLICLFLLAAAHRYLRRGDACFLYSIPQRRMGKKYCTFNKLMEGKHAQHDFYSVVVIIVVV